MDIVKFFKHETLVLPLKRTTSDSTFIDFYDKTVSHYINKVEDLQFQKFEKCEHLKVEIFNNLQNIKKLSIHIKQAIECTLKGSPALAYRQFHQGMSAVKKHIDNLKILSRADLNMNQLYRIRTIDNHEQTIERTGMFHVPYNLRHLVQPRRYSLPGVPCLYLGGSLYVCWEELGRPKFESIYFSRFSADQSKVCLLDFGYKPEFVGNLVASLFRECYKDSPLYNFVVAQAVCWPLLAACSIRRLNLNSPFYHEYIVPQLLLQWIADKKKSSLDGIRYFSVASNSTCQNPFMLCNYVFPCQGVEKLPDANIAQNQSDNRWRNYNTEILKLFKFTDPLYWPIVERTVFTEDVSHRVPQQRNSELKGPGIFNTYEKTPFGYMEGKSLNFKLKSFSDN